jgi:hypothetical protein
MNEIDVKMAPTPRVLLSFFANSVSVGIEGGYSKIAIDVPKAESAKY